MHYVVDLIVLAKNLVLRAQALRLGSEVVMMDRFRKHSAATDRFRRLAQRHIDLLGEHLVHTLAAELEKSESAWKTHVRELHRDNERLSAELRRFQGESNRADHPDWPSRSQDSLHVSQASPEGKPRKSLATVLSNLSIGSIGSVHSVLSNRASLFRTSDMFKELDVAATGVVKIDALERRIRAGAVDESAAWLHNISPLVQRVREAKPLLFAGLREDELSYAVFKELMLGQDVESYGAEHVATLNALRATLIDDTVAHAVSDAFAVRREEIDGRFSNLAHADRSWWLEPVIGWVILFNAAIIGLRLDIEPESSIWNIGELVCTVFFAFELVLRLYFNGFLEYFFGSDWKWHWFDFILIIIAVLDVILEFGMTTAGRDSVNTGVPRDVTMLRLTRVLRIARLGRLLRLRSMRELIVMVTGIIGGLRTLFWALVLLFNLVYVLGILLHQIMSEWKRSTPCGVEGFTCDFAEQALYDDYGPMFDDLFKTSFTVFRCVTGDCNLSGGLPLAPALLETQGRLLAVVYACSLLFVIVCVFNLIMAVFVEGTLEYAKQDQQKARHVRYQDQIRVARKLQRLVDKILVRAGKPSSETPQRVDGLLRYLPNKGFLAPSEAVDEGIEVQLPLHLKVTRETFDEVMAEPGSEELLEELEITLYSPSKLFDILDSNGNRELDIQEIVDGIMRLRGPADKGDVVSNALMIRSLQRSFDDLKLDIARIHPQPARTSTKPSSLGGNALETGPLGTDGAPAACSAIRAGLTL